ncbi:MAG TPA: malto-oligosyltrehalose trehalohydrolase [Longimicrobiaceae bacterium]|nr:malto-oligosyltrehalose trehalohydrolase [Longimicrobiaceae bacterium]
MTTAARRAMRLGARPEPGAVHFRLWSPGSRTVEVVLHGAGRERVEPLHPDGGGYFAGRVEGVGPGARYRYRIDGGRSYPDPASRWQPEGVHGPSEVVDPDAFEWTDQGWRGVPLQELVVYELHVGTFTAEGTFDAAVGRLDALADLGVTAIEVMPIANFPGARNWGYDGVNLFAPAAAYGPPDAFRRLVDAAHRRGLAVLLDVVYNHLGPEGNYLPEITHGRIFTGRHHTPWGPAIDYDGPESAGVRDLVVENALYWIEEYHVDGLRLDATHAILDDSPVHILREIAARVHAVPGRRRIVIAEDERNDRRLVTRAAEGGYGLDAVWADDLHHQLRRLTAGDREGYFARYSGTVGDVVETLRRGWFYEGQHAPHRGTPRGTSAAGIAPPHFVHCLENHDQVGNRPFGGRLSHEVPLSVYRALSALLLLSPYTPLLWMGQEWAASSPFLFFTDHPEELGRRVTEGRREEFKHFSAFRDPETREHIPDPQAARTFARSKLRWPERSEPPHAGVLTLYRELLALRRSHPALRDHTRGGFRVSALGQQALVLRREAEGAALLLLLNFGGALDADLAADPITRAPQGCRWELLLDTEEARFGGAGEGATLRRGRLAMREAGGIVLDAGPTAQDS